MDTTETYIKMCEKADQIQAVKVQYFQQHGNYFADSITHPPSWLISCDVCFDLTKEPDRFIWLPRQDQLQEMVRGNYVDKLRELSIAVRDFKLTQYHYTEKEFPFTSMEQLWLAFVMKEKYNKVWDGKDWVK